MSSLPCVSDVLDDDDDEEEDLELLLEKEMNHLSEEEEEEEVRVEVAIVPSAPEVSFDESLRELFLSSVATLDRAAQFDAEDNPRPEQSPRESHESSGVYMCKSVENDLRHGNYICKSEGIHLSSEDNSRLARRERSPDNDEPHDEPQTCHVDVCGRSRQLSAEVAIDAVQVGPAHEVEGKEQEMRGKVKEELEEEVAEVMALLLAAIEQISFSCEGAGSDVGAMAPESPCLSSQVHMHSRTMQSSVGRSTGVLNSNRCESHIPSAPRRLLRESSA